MEEVEGQSVIPEITSGPNAKDEVASEQPLETVGVTGILLTIHPKSDPDLSLTAHEDKKWKETRAYLAKTTDVVGENTWVLTNKGCLIHEKSTRYLQGRGKKKNKHHLVTRGKRDDLSQNWVFLAEEDDFGPKFVLMRWFDVRCLTHKNRKLTNQPRSGSVTQSWILAPKNVSMESLTDFIKRNFLFVDPIRWMTQLSPFIGDRPLRKILIPGTHDSATASINSKSKLTTDAPPICKKPIGKYIGGVISGWSKAQSLTIEDQLKSGIRYFDIRTVNHEGDFWTCHGLAGEPLENAYNDMAEFLHHNPNEIVIIIMDHFYDLNAEDHDRLQHMIINIFGDMLYARQVKRPKGMNVTLHELQETSHQVVMFYKPTTLNGDLMRIWPCSRGVYESIWPNSQDLVHLKTNLDSQIKRHIEGDALEHLWVVQGVMTPSSATIAKGVIGPTAPESLETLARRTNPALREWLHKDEEWRKCTINIVIADWVETCGFLAACMDRNIEIARAIAPSGVRMTVG